jgi:hypothetical protein
MCQVTPSFRRCSLLGLQVVVLPLDLRVERRRLAAALGLPPSRVALAPPGHLKDLCGYPGEASQ